MILGLFQAKVYEFNAFCKNNTFIQDVKSIKHNKNKQTIIEIQKSTITFKRILHEKNGSV